MKRALSLFLPLFFCVVIAGRGEGADLSGLQPPAPYGVFSTMSANTPGKGRAAVGLSLEKSGVPDFYRLSTHLAFGIGDNVEASISIPYLEATTSDASGLEDIAFGVKHRFSGEGLYGPSVAYILTASVDSGVLGLGTEGRYGAGLAVSKKVGPVNGHANLFYMIPSGPGYEPEIRISTGIEFSAARNFNILGELYGRKSHFSESLDQLEARLGYRFRSANDVFTTLGVGFDLKDLAPEYRLMGSVSTVFPRDGRPYDKPSEEDR